MHYSLFFVTVAVMVFLIEIVFPESISYFALSRSSLLQRPWTIVTHIFTHGDVQHLLYNMFGLALFGFILERIIGSKKFLLVFFSSGITSGLVGLFFYHSLIGASGTVYGIMGFLGIIRPKMVVWTLGVPMPMVAALFVWGAFNFAGLFTGGQIAYVGHLGGLAVGVLMGLHFRSRYRLPPAPEVEDFLSDEEFEEWERRYMRKKEKK
jgi:hypothetical protein